MKNSHGKIIVVNTPTYDEIYEYVSRTFKLHDKVPITDNDKVVLKINLCDARPPETGGITHPKFLDAVLRYLRQHYENLEINVIESDGNVAMPDLFVKWFNFKPILQKWDANYINLSKTKASIEKINGEFLSKMLVPDLFEEADVFISLPKPKTNLQTKITCCLKNQFGCLPVVWKEKLHPILEKAIVDVNLAMTPDLCIVDGVIGMTGLQGPAFGKPVRSNFIMLGSDPVAIDSLVAKLFGYDPHEVPHIKLAEKAGLGSTKYKILGEPDPLKDANLRVSKFWFKIMQKGSEMSQEAHRRLRE